VFCEARKMSCPLCSARVPTYALEAHVNACLDNQERAARAASLRAARAASPPATPLRHPSQAFLAASAAAFAGGAPFHAAFHAHGHPLRSHLRGIEAEALAIVQQAARAAGPLAPPRRGALVARVQAPGPGARAGPPRLEVGVVLHAQAAHSAGAFLRVAFLPGVTLEQLLPPPAAGAGAPATPLAAAAAALDLHAAPQIEVVRFGTPKSPGEAARTLLELIDRAAVGAGAAGAAMGAAGAQRHAAAAYLAVLDPRPPTAPPPAAPLPAAAAAAGADADADAVTAAQEGPLPSPPTPTPTPTTAPAAATFLSPHPLLALPPPGSVRLLGAAPELVAPESIVCLSPLHTTAHANAHAHAAWSGSGGLGGGGAPPHFMQPLAWLGTSSGAETSAPTGEPPMPFAPEASARAPTRLPLFRAYMAVPDLVHA